MNTEPTQPTVDIPKREMYMAIDLDRGMQMLGHKRWELGPVCSRNLLEEARAKIYNLERGMEEWKMLGIIELSIRNPNVELYMKHWEHRALKAERELDKFLHTGSGSDL